MHSEGDQHDGGVAARLLETSYAPSPLGLLTPGALGESGWVKALQLDEYVPRGSQEAGSLAGRLVPFLAGAGG